MNGKRRGKQSGIMKQMNKVRSHFKVASVIFFTCTCTIAPQIACSPATGLEGQYLDRTQPTARLQYPLALLEQTRPLFFQQKAVRQTDIHVVNAGILHRE